MLDRTVTSVEGITDAAVTAGIQGAHIAAAVVRVMARRATRAARQPGSTAGEPVANAAEARGRGVANAGSNARSKNARSKKKRSTRRRDR
jgi:hypothetical protein